MIPVPYTRDDARTYLRHIIPGGWETDREWGFVVEAHRSGVPRFAGTISLRNRGEGRAEIAYGSHPWVRGRGVMERALRLLLELGLRRSATCETVHLAGAPRQLGLAPARLASSASASTGTLRELARRSAAGCVDAWVGTLRRGDARWHRGSDVAAAPRIVGEPVVLRANA